MSEPVIISGLDATIVLILRQLLMAEDTVENVAGCDVIYMVKDPAHQPAPKSVEVLVDLKFVDLDPEGNVRMRRAVGEVIDRWTDLIDDIPVLLTAPRAATPLPPPKETRPGAALAALYAIGAGLEVPPSFGRGPRSVVAGAGTSGRACVCATPNPTKRGRCRNMGCDGLVLR